MERTQRYQSVRKVTQDCLSFSEGAVVPRIRMRLLAPTPNVDANGGIRVSKRGNATIAIKLEETQDLNCVSKRLPKRYVLSTIDHHRRNNFRVRYCRNGERHIRTRERTGLHWVLFSGRKSDRNPDAPTFRNTILEDTTTVPEKCSLHRLRM